MTHFLKDVLRQPEELQRVIDFFCKVRRTVLDDAAKTIQNARHVYVTGIGGSWHAALNAKSLFHRGGFPVHGQDAAELLHFDTLPKGSVIIVISRSGRSAEIIKLLAKAHRCRATIIGITNAGDGPLVCKAQLPIIVPVGLDHAISVNTYSTLSAAAGALASAVVGAFDDSVAASLVRAVGDAARALPGWQQQIAGMPWPMSHSVNYFLARGPSLGSCYEAQLLWQEGVKSPATALGTGAFRHGPQEVVTKEMRFVLWIDGQRMREQDLAVARDLRQLGAYVMLIGQDVPENSGDVVFQLPHIRPEWQFLIDIMPVQLAADRVASLSGVDCDSFRICRYIVEDEYGLLHDGEARSV